MKQVSIRPTYPAKMSEFYIGEDLLQTNLLETLCAGKRPVIIADESLAHLAQKLSGQILYVPKGEAAKTRKVKEQIEEELLRLQFGRDTVLIALGGGATLDLVGFVAATYLRGVSLILIPTTLLAMVDASIGGKTAIDTPAGKNLIGSFYPPDAVIADLKTLETLPEKEKLSGLAEVLKMGLIYDASILEDLTLREELILKAAQAKIDIIEKDPLDRGLRSILNFGHTIAHGLEQLSQFALPHGQAVGIGTLTESYLSYRLGLLSKADFEAIERLYLPLCFQKLPANYSRPMLLSALENDKKKKAGALRFVLLDAIGCAASFEGAYCQTVPEEMLQEALSYMEKIYG